MTSQHNGDSSIPQEFYRWESVAQAAKNALDIRLRLLDYIYTAFHQASLDGTPILHPLWYLYPKDTNTFGIDYQFFYGDSILVSPVVEEGSTSVTYYLPEELWYDFNTLGVVEGTGQNVTLDDVSVTEIPLHIRGGSVLPLRTESTMTTEELRTKPFEIVVAPDANGNAKGALYADDGVSLEQPSRLFIKFEYVNGTLGADGEFGFDVGVGVQNFTILGQTASPQSVSVNGKETDFDYDEEKKVVSIGAEVPLTGKFEVKLQ